ncbi:serine/threonine-protein kinase [Actinosynnema sp. NPDC047251]|nr:serine/threonine-protein kinase [Saccharothrix espanaensis]
MADVGQLVGGRHRLVEALDFGGMGRVWRARDEVLQLDVAVKEVWLSPGMSAVERDERLARARREARNAAALRDHPNIVAVHDVVTEDGVPWIVMRLVTGESLERRLEKGALGGDSATKVAGDLLNALEAAHAAGIVHRDVKPANVLLNDRGDALLTDFGIAVHSADTSITGTGTLIGSVEYMAPERLNGQDGLPASDLYSLGVTLFQAVEGLSPFRRDTPTATLTAVLLEPTPSPTRAGPLAPLIAALLDRDPARRPSIVGARALLGSPTGPISLPLRKATRKLEVEGASRGVAVPAIPPVGKGVAGKVVGAVVLVVVAGLFLFRGQIIDGVANAIRGGGGSGSSATSQDYRTTQDYSTTTETTTTTPAFDPTDLDRESTDRTPLTSAGLLPESFVDAKEVKYNLTNASTRACVTDHLSDEVRSILVESGCRDALAATYVDASDQIVVMVWVVPMADKQTATTAYDAYRSGSWGILCPTTDPGSRICGTGGDTDAAVQSGFTSRSHRYLIHTASLYINLTQDASAEPWLRAAADKAASVAGPLNYPGNR